MPSADTEPGQPAQAAESGQSSPPEPAGTPAGASGRRPRVGEFYAVNRGGGLYSEAVSQWLGALVAVAADRLRIAPTVLTLLNVVVGAAASVAVVVFAPAAAAGDVPGWLLGVVALVAWQIAYAIDCADGQLARVTGQTSPAGGRVDVLADVLVQILLVTALASAAVAYRPSTPAWLIAIFAGTWMVNLVTSVMQTGAQAASMVPTTSLPVRVVKLIRDYGAVVLTCGLVLTFVPDATFWVLVAFSVVNGLFLMASVGHSARHALKPKS